MSSDLKDLFDQIEEDGAQLQQVRSAIEEGEDRWLRSLLILARDSIRWYRRAAVEIRDAGYEMEKLPIGQRGGSPYPRAQTYLTMAEALLTPVNMLRGQTDPHVIHGIEMAIVRLVPSDLSERMRSNSLGN
ncbi:hypothetical protein MK805_14200 [Shimazuella sp. AN120528]|uniref:hypothetical protein n=1 Tax=Shimazuella soli TaxID=1892854 RepID=UPI001F113927|nr:hypothetical protein [Shimazuella soli]MCH5586090.1 hypothetical protein [Shimazuella soli]